MAESATQNRGSRLVVGAVLLAMLAIWAWQTADEPVEPRTIHGWARPSSEGAAIGLFSSPEGGEGEGYIIAGARWSDGGGAWHDGATGPTCVGTNVQAIAEVELGVIEVQDDDGGSWSHVVWLRCL